MASKQQQKDQQEALERLRGWVKDGDTVYCLLRHRSTSGMSRVIQLLTIHTIQVDCGIPQRLDRPVIGHIGFNVAKAIGYTYDKRHEGVKVGGCGFDAGHAIVYELQRVLGYETLRHEWL